ncbi:hypothetical protein [Sunxiuqinia indica]|uniref:hypothetical protein n=1 Tax=Sunxiuqinia indica TaxID=2692584 RepID=UPI001356BBB9|nr:hypothetical protein [Sunxiuqinia indica]
MKNTILSILGMAIMAGAAFYFDVKNIDLLKRIFAGLFLVPWVLCLASIITANRKK